MTIAELKAIVNNCETNPKEEVMLKIKMHDGTIANAHIKSFSTYTDGLVLNTEMSPTADA